MSNKLSKQLKAAIKDSGLTPYRIAKLAGTSTSIVCRFLNGKGSLSLDIASSICSVLGLHLAQIDGFELPKLSDFPLRLGRAKQNSDS